jgi:acid phosphatase
MRLLARFFLTALLFSPWLGAQPPLRHDLALPNLGVTKQLVRNYYSSGAYREDLQRVTDAAQSYLESNLARYARVKPALVLDIDETAISNLDYFQKFDMAYLPLEFSAWLEVGESPAIPEVLNLYRWSRARGVAVFFISGRLEKQRAATDRNLRKAGYLEWQELILKPEGSNEPSSLIKPEQRKRIISQGFAIVANLGDQESDLSGGYAEAQFKLPNPIYIIP